jgi:chromosome segregation ATPase
MGLFGCSCERDHAALRTGLGALAETLTDLHVAVAHVRRDVSEVRRTALPRLERIIMTSADNLAARIDAATNELASDLTEVKTALREAVANADAKTRAALEAELAKLDAPIARLEALGADPADPVPAPVDETPVDEPAPVDPSDPEPTPAA